MVVFRHQNDGRARLNGDYRARYDHQAKKPDELPSMIPLGVCDTQLLKQSMLDVNRVLQYHGLEQLFVIVDGHGYTIPKTPLLLAALALHRYELDPQTAGQILYAIQTEDWFNEFWEGKRLALLDPYHCEVYFTLVCMSTQQMAGI